MLTLRDNFNKTLTEISRVQVLCFNCHMECEANE